MPGTERDAILPELEEAPDEVRQALAIAMADDDGGLQSERDPELKGALAKVDVLARAEARVERADSIEGRAPKAHVVGDQMTRHPPERPAISRDHRRGAVGNVGDPVAVRIGAGHRPPPDSPVSPCCRLRSRAISLPLE